MNIISFVYNDYFYQATVTDFNPIQSDVKDGNSYSLMVEVPNFQSLEATILLRTKINLYKRILFIQKCKTN